jgi:hypothetical protein
MRYLNLTMILTSTVTLMLACGDSGGTDGASETGTGDTGGTASETTAETGTASGDGDGDTNTGDGDGDTNTGDGDGDGDGPGDGDGDGPGDGDGDGPGDGDGDGDGDGGDGDGDAGCEPGNNSPCALCTAENCCDELMACEGDQDCACLTECVGEGGDPIECFGMCGIDPNGMNQALMDLRACTMSECANECAMP